MSKQEVDNLDTEKLELHLKHVFEHGVNFKERVITIVEDISSSTFKHFEAALTEMEAHNKKAITLKIMSEGGSVYSALAIVGRMRASKCRIITEGYGQIMSAATLILAHGHVRRMSELGWFMHHEASYNIEGRHSHVKDITKQVDREEHKWSEALAKVTKMDETFWKKLGVRKDVYLTAEDLLTYGVVDEII